MSRLQKAKGWFTAPAEYEYEEAGTDVAYEEYADDGYGAEVAEMRPQALGEVGEEFGRIVTARPIDFLDEELMPFTQAYREGVPVILDLSRASDAMVRRLSDYVFGLAAGVNGRVSQISPAVLLLSPAHVTVENPISK